MGDCTYIDTLRQASYSGLYGQPDVLGVTAIAEGYDTTPIIVRRKELRLLLNVALFEITTLDPLNKKSVGWEVFCLV